MATDVTTIIAYVAIICIILVALYFQFKILGLDVRTREAEKVVKTYEDVLKASTIGEELKKKLQVVQSAISDIRDQSGRDTESLYDVQDELDALKVENHKYAKAYRKLISSIKEQEIEGLTIPDECVLEEPPKQNQTYGGLPPYGGMQRGSYGGNINHGANVPNYPSQEASRYPNQPQYGSFGQGAYGAYADEFNPQERTRRRRGEPQGYSHPEVGLGFNPSGYPPQSSQLSQNYPQNQPRGFRGQGKREEMYAQPPPPSNYGRHPPQNYPPMNQPYGNQYDYTQEEMMA